METPVSPKVVAGGAVGAVAVVLIWVLGLVGLEVPPEVVVAVTVLLTVGASYLKRDPLRDAGQAYKDGLVNRPTN